MCSTGVCMAGGGVCAWQGACMTGRGGERVCRRDGHWSGRYAFYWNAFFLLMVSVSHLSVAPIVNKCVTIKQFTCEIMDNIPYWRHALSDYLHKQWRKNVWYIFSVSTSGSLTNNSNHDWLKISVHVYQSSFIWLDELDYIVMIKSSWQLSKQPGLNSL